LTLPRKFGSEISPGVCQFSLLEDLNFDIDLIINLGEEQFTKNSENKIHFELGWVSARQIFYRQMHFGPKKI